MPAAYAYSRVAIRRPRPADLLPISLVCWGLVGIALCAFDGLETWISTAGPLMASQAFCATLLLHRYRVVRHAVIPDFLTMFLLFKLIDDTVTLAGQLVQHSQFAVAVSIQNAGLGALSIDVADAYQAQAELALLSATVIIAITWTLLERRRIVALWDEPAAKNTWIALIISGVAYFLLPAGGAGQLHSLLKFFTLGAMGVLLGGQSRYAFGKRYSVFVYLAAVPMLISAFRSGMKGEVLLVLIPVLLPLLRKMNARRAALWAFFLAAVLLVIFPFSQTWRDANWVHGPGRQSQNIGFAETMRRVGDQWQSHGVINTSITSTAKWLSRGSSAQTGGLVMQIAHDDGHLGPTLLKGLTTIFVPRFLWPDKPSYAPGAWFTWYLGEADSPATATTATAMTTPAELYWEFGPLGVLIGMALITAINFLVWTRLLKWARSNVVPLVALFAILIAGSQLEGTFVVYALSAPIILLVYVAALRFVHRLWVVKFRNPAFRRA